MNKGVFPPDILSAEVFYFFRSETLEILEGRFRHTCKYAQTAVIEIHNITGVMLVESSCIILLKSLHFNRPPGMTEGTKGMTEKNVWVLIKIKTSLNADVA